MIETPKEDKYFDNVFNFVLVSDETAVEAMSKKVQEFDLDVSIASTNLYDETSVALDKIFNAKKGPTFAGFWRKSDLNGSVVLASGEPSIVVPKEAGKGGRNLHMGLLAIKNEMKNIGDDSVFISFASDGMDNSDAAGAVVDKKTLEHIEKLGINVDDALERFDSYLVFEKSGDMIMTGPTGANVSDLMLLLTKK